MMDEYISYYSFFSESTKIIKDVRADFAMAGFSGTDFDKEYGTFINRFSEHCRNHMSSSFMGHSAVLAGYIKDIGTTRDLPQRSRFEELSHITDRYMRNAV